MTRVADGQPDRGQQEIESTESCIGSDGRDVGFMRTDRHCGHESARERGLRAAENHHPLRTIALPAANRGGELEQTGENRPHRKDTDDCVHAEFERDGDGADGDGADDEIKGLRRIALQAAIALGVESVRDGIPGGIGDEQETCDLVMAPCDSDCGRNPGRRYDGTGQVVVSQPACGRLG